MDDAIMYVNLPRQNNRRFDPSPIMIYYASWQHKLKKTHIGAYIKLQQEMTAKSKYSLPNPTPCTSDPSVRLSEPA